MEEYMYRKCLAVDGIVGCGPHDNQRHVSWSVRSRRRNATKPEMNGGECEFVEGKDANNGTYILWRLSESAKEVETDMYICITGYTETPDGGEREETFEITKTIKL